MQGNAFNSTGTAVGGGGGNGNPSSNKNSNSGSSSNKRRKQSRKLQMSHGHEQSGGGRNVASSDDEGDHGRGHGHGRSRSEKAKVDCISNSSNSGSKQNSNSNQNQNRDQCSKDIHINKLNSSFGGSSENGGNDGNHGSNGSQEGHGSNSNKNNINSNETNEEVVEDEDDEEPDWATIAQHEPARSDVPLFIDAKDRREAAEGRFASALDEAHANLKQCSDDLLKTAADLCNVQREKLDSMEVQIKQDFVDNEIARSQMQTKLEESASAAQAQFAQLMMRVTQLNKGITAISSSVNELNDNLQG